MGRKRLKYTNKHHLSQEIYDAIVARQNQYSSGDVDYSVTEILNPPRIVHLTKRHYDELEMDVIDVMDAWEGHLLHDALERTETTNRLVYKEENYPSLSGAYDYFFDGLLKDYKRTSVWSFVFGSVQEKWEQQLNIYAWLLQREGKKVQTCGIEVFLKDWNKNEALRNKDYPQVPQFFLRMPLWSFEGQENFVQTRLFIMRLAGEFSDESLDYCIEKEMWARPNVYAVKKVKAKRAMKLFEDKQEAEDWIQKMGYDLIVYIEERPGERVRCAKYCQVAPFCNQWKEYKNDMDFE